MQNKGFDVRRPPKHTAKHVYAVCLSGKLTAKSGSTDIFQILNICAAIFTVEAIFATMAGNCKFSSLLCVNGPLTPNSVRQAEPLDRPRMWDQINSLPWVLLCRALLAYFAVCPVLP
jgi:hypothetical protein